MNSPDARRTVLLLDAAGCAVSAGLIASLPALLRPVDPTLRSRWPLVAALGATSLTCAVGARSTTPSHTALRAAATLNGGWVAACATTLVRHRHGRLGMTLVATTAALDAGIGTAQWALSRRRPLGPR